MCLFSIKWATWRRPWSAAVTWYCTEKLKSRYAVSEIDVHTCSKTDDSIDKEMCRIFGFAGRMDSSVCQSTTLVWTKILKRIGWISLECCTNIHLPYIMHADNSGECLTFLLAPPWGSHLQFWVNIGTYCHFSLRMNCNDSMILWLSILCPYFVVGMSTTIRDCILLDKIQMYDINVFVR